MTSILLQYKNWNAFSIVLIYIFFYIHLDDALSVQRRLHIVVSNDCNRERGPFCVQYYFSGTEKKLIHEFLQDK